MRLKTMCSAILIIAGVVLLGPVTTGFAADAVNPPDPATTLSYDQARRFEAGPFVGYHFFDKSHNLKDRFTYGARLGYNFTSRFAVEGSVGMVKTNVDDASKRGAQKGEFRFPTDSMDITSYQLNAMYQFKPERRFSPFVVAGFGNSRYSPAVLGNDIGTIDLGVGAKYWIKKDVALRVDLRDHMESSFRNYDATVEVVFAFGGRARRTPVEVARADPKPQPTEVISEPVSPKVEETGQPVVSDAKSEEREIVLTFEDVHFNFDKSTLTDAAKVILHRTIQKLKDNPKTRVRIAGCTSVSGSDEYNQRLGERRANAVEKYLVNEGGISSDRLSTVSYGETRLAQHEAFPKHKYSPAAKANMRVIFETIVR